MANSRNKGAPDPPGAGPEKIPGEANLAKEENRDRYAENVNRFLTYLQEPRDGEVPAKFGASLERATFLESDDKRPAPSIHYPRVSIGSESSLGQYGITGVHLKTALESEAKFVPLNGKDAAKLANTVAKYAELAGIAPVEIEDTYLLFGNSDTTVRVRAKRDKSGRPVLEAIKTSPTGKSYSGGFFEREHDILIYEASKAEDLEGARDALIGELAKSLAPYRSYSEATGAPLGKLPEGKSELVRGTKRRYSFNVGGNVIDIDFVGELRNGKISDVTYASVEVEGRGFDQSSLNFYRFLTDGIKMIEGPENTASFYKAVSAGDTVPGLSRPLQLLARKTKGENGGYKL